ncbi:unnamed protein product [Sphagnum balticum]
MIAEIAACIAECLAETSYTCTAVTWGAAANDCWLIDPAHITSTENLYDNQQGNLYPLGATTANYMTCFMGIPGYNCVPGVELMGLNPNGNAQTVDLSDICKKGM